MEVRSVGYSTGTDFDPNRSEAPAGRASALDTTPRQGDRMASKTDYLERVYVVSPCKANWESMAGTDQARHCAECNRQVYDLSKMTRRQAEHLIIITQGRFCARITRGPNGDVVTQEEPGLHLITKHASPVATAVVSAAITVGSAAPALAGIHRQQTQVSVAAKTKESAPVSIDAPGAAVLSGKVSDAEGAVSGARLVLRSSTLDERATSGSE